MMMTNAERCKSALTWEGKVRFVITGGLDTGIQTGTATVAIMVMVCTCTVGIDGGLAGAGVEPSRKVAECRLFQKPM